MKISDLTSIAGIGRYTSSPICDLKDKLQLKAKSLYQFQLTTRFYGISKFLGTIKTEYIKFRAYFTSSNNFFRLIAYSRKACAPSFVISMIVSGRQENALRVLM